MTALRFCINSPGEEKLKTWYDEMMVGPNRQPCAVCGKPVKAEYGFCHICGKVLCGEHFDEHLTSEVPLGELENR